jgi:hypothetical protein
MVGLIDFIVLAKNLQKISRNTMPALSNLVNRRIAEFVMNR